MKTTTVKPEEIDLFCRAFRDVLRVLKPYFDEARCAGLMNGDKFCVNPKRAVEEIQPISVKMAIAQLIECKQRANRSPRYLHTLKQFMSQFEKGRERMPLCDVTHTDIEQLLAQHNNTYSRATWLSRLSTLFSFAVRRGYIQTNPCAQIDRVSIDRKPPAVLTPVQVKLLLEKCDDWRRQYASVSMVPYLVLGMYAGIRPEECERLTWKDINLETGTVKIDRAKVRRRRIVPLEPIAVRLLKQHVKPDGPVCPSHATVKRWKHHARETLGLKIYPTDLLRHTAASYLIALYKDAGKVATMLGNSSQVLLTHYHEPVTEADCKAFWGLIQS